jgi:hypothetical protein
MYQRGIVELELETFVHLPFHQLSDGQKNFRCGLKNINNDFTSVLHHWRECPAIGAVEWLTSYSQVRQANSFLFCSRGASHGSFFCLLV